MSREGLRALASKLASDAAYKKRVLSEGDAALAEFDLSGEEKEAVLKTRQRLALDTGNEQLEIAGPLGFWY